MKYLLFLLPFLLLSPALGELRTFTNQEGQTIQARIVRIEGDNVAIEREDRRLFRIAIDTLSEKDQEFIRRWPTRKALADEREVEIRTRRSRLSRVVEDENPVFADSLYYRATRQEYVYQVVFNNRGLEDLTDLTVEYRILKDRAAHGSVEMRGPATRPRRMVISGTIELERAKSREETILETEPFFLIETIREEWAPDYVHGSRTVEIRREDVLHGIWIRVKDGDDIVREEISSQNLPRRMSWE